MTTKKNLLIGAVLLLMITGGTIGFLQFRTQLFPTPSSAEPSSIPLPSQAGSCTTNDQCEWFSKLVENNSGQPDETLDTIMTCANTDYLESCGADCTSRGNPNPYDQAQCACVENQCESNR